MFPQQVMTLAMRKGSTRLVIAVPAILLLIVVALPGVWWMAKQKAVHERARWRQALEQLAGLSFTNDQIAAELDQIKHPKPGLNFGWTHEHVLLMTNGERIIYAFRHGADNGFVDHLFLGHGSDGRWFYSTYHFCNSMAAVAGDGPPGSITEFENRYSVREFDGKSDECLKHTWPPK